jgi:YidC/Oxa1 family membrane protein insertase
MDRNTTIGYVLILLIFAGYLFLTQRNVKDIEKIKQQKDSVETVAGLDTAQSPITAQIADSQASVLPDTMPEKLFSIENKDIRVLVSNKGGRIASVVLKNYKRYDSTELVLFTGDKTEFSYTIPVESGVIQTKNVLFSSDRQNVVVSEGNSAITLTANVDGASLQQVYSLSTSGFLLDYKLKLNGFEKKIAKKNRDFELNWNLLVQGQEKTLEEEKLVTNVEYKYLEESGIESLSERGDDEERLQGNIHWIAYKQKFFNSTLIAPKGFSEDGFKIKSTNIEESQGIDIKLLSSTLYFPYDFSSSASYDLQFYFGPNHYSTLKKLDIGLQKIIPLGWGIFGWVNKFLVIPIFNVLSSFISNYGLIILLLTILIKLVLFPFMYKIYVSTAKMRLLKPELDELKEKTGGDMQKMQQEQLKLYRKAGVNPFGGCLPQLIQLPILIAMFRFFPAAIELRQQPFLWAEDLSTYDSILQLGFEIPFYGSHVSLFTLLMAISTFIYTIKNTQQMSGMGNQFKIISYIMPVMLLFWFNSYASGLSYYYFLANMITFGQNWIIKAFFVDEDKLHRQIKENKAKKGTAPKSSFQQRLEDMAKKRGLDPKTGRKK